MTDDNKKKSAGDHVEDLGVDWPDLTQESEAIAEAMQTAAIVQKIGQTMFHSFSATREELQAVFNSEEWQRAVEALKTLVESLPAWIRIIPDINEIAPYLSEELQKPEYEGKTLDNLFFEAEEDEEGHTAEDSLFMQALAKARAARDADAAKEEPAHATIRRAHSIEYPLDKPNSIIWNLLEKDTQGQISFNMAKYGSKKKIPAYYSIDFDDLENDIQITKRLLPFDKRVYIAVSALFNAGKDRKSVV